MITLTSDFGLSDPYVAEMKGAILTINPAATIIDITHCIENFNIRKAAFTLASATPYFPKGTVHVAVVDPGVGTQRRAIAIQAKKGFFVGPDNGVLVLAAKNQGIEHVCELSNPKFMLPEVSNTFHGRDIFAPAAAHLDTGVKLSEFGPEVNDSVMPEFVKVKRDSDSLVGEVLDIDGFGNVVTNLTEKDVDCKEGAKINFEFPSASLTVTFEKAYAQAKPKEPILLVGSHGFLEIALNQASAVEKFHAKSGDKIKLALA